MRAVRGASKLLTYSSIDSAVSFEKYGKVSKSDMISHSLFDTLPYHKMYMCKERNELLQ